MRKKTLYNTLFLGISAVVSFFYCNTLKNPYLNPEKVELVLVLKDSKGSVGEDLSVTDSVGSTIHAGIIVNLPGLVDSATVTIKKYANNKDSVFVFNNIESGVDTQWSEFTFTKTGGWIVSAAAYTRGGEPRKVIGDVTIVPKFPTVVVSPKVQTGPIGGARTFLVTAQGDSPFSFQWFHGTTVIPGDTDETLFRRKLLYDDSGSYFCVVKDKWGDTVTTGPSILKIIEKPTFSVMIASSKTTQNVDSTVVFTVTAGGDTPFTYQWYHDSSALSGKTDTILSIGPLVLADSGNFACGVKNKYGDFVLSSPVVLHVVPNRLILESIKDIAVVSRNGGVTVFKWNKTSDADSFYIYRSKDTAGFVLLKSVSDTFFMDSIKGTAFYYYVVGSSSKGASVPSHLLFSGSINSAPAWIHDTIKVEVSEAASCSLHLADSVSDENGDNISLRLSGGNPGSDTLIGTLWTCSPSYSDSGSYAITVTASDSIATAPGILTILLHVTNVNRPPVPQRQDTLSAINSAPKTITLTATDPDKDAIKKWRIAKPAINGTATLADSAVASVVYASNAGLVGVDSFSFDAFDGSAWSAASASVIIAVDSINVQPQVTKEPRADTTVYPGASVSFYVRINKPYPAPSFMWYKGTIENCIKIDSQSTLQITKAAVSDSGWYFVIVSNPAGRDTSEYAHVKVYIPPQITKQPWVDTAVAIGTGFTFTIGINLADPPPVFAWYKGVKGSAKKIDSVQTMTRQFNTISDSGIYFAVVSNSAGSDTSDYAHLSVIRIPMITQEPIDINACVGEPDSFFVMAKGAALSYQWIHNGAPITTATTRVLKFFAVTIADSGTYSCTITNSAGKANSKVARLSINSVSIAPSSVTAASPTICQGTSTILSIKGGTLGSGAAEWKWHTGSCGGFLSGIGTSISSGVLNSTTTFYVGTQGICNSTCDSVTITVTGSASIASGPSPNSQTKYSGSSAIFTISAIGAEPLLYRWEKNGTHVGGSFPSCTLYNVSRSDSGAAITCKVSNACNSTEVTSGAATLKVISFLKTAAGGNSTIVVASDSTAWGFGDNGFGQLGDGTTADKTYPVRVMKFADEPLTGVIAIAEGAGHSLFLLADGTVWACGANANGQLGDGTNNDRCYAVKIPSLSQVTAIAAGDKHSIFLAGTSTALTPYLCGNNEKGQLGLGTLTNTNTPTVLSVGPQTNVYGICAGAFHSMFCNNSNTNGLVSCGLNSDGQLGDGTTTNRTTPVVLALVNPQGIAAGYGHSIMVDKEWKLYLWGDNSFGQLGPDSFSSQLHPYLLNKINDPRFVAAGSYHSLVLTASGILWSFGRNNYGQLGINSTVDQKYPAHLSSDVKSMAGGTGHTIFVKNDGTLWTCGSNNHGQLGIGNTEDSHEVVRVKFY
jgi:alpha-tubulin suppressor-like RCC1 family protein